MLVLESSPGRGRLLTPIIGIPNGRLTGLADGLSKLPILGLCALGGLRVWGVIIVWLVMIRREINSLITRMWWGHRKDNSRLSLELALVCR
jgi:hypothetical protein